MAKPGPREVLAALLDDFPDFPSPGIVFKDISRLLADADGFRVLVDELAGTAAAIGGVDLVAGVEARGFVLGAPVAAALGVGFLPLRKAGKLPGTTRRRSYALEYGSAELEVRPVVVPSGARVLLVDDVLATGGTLAAAALLLEECGASVAQIAVLLEIAALDGQALLSGRPLRALLRV